MAKATQKCFRENSMALKPWIFSPVDLFPSMVWYVVKQMNFNEGELCTGSSLLWNQLITSSCFELCDIHRFYCQKVYTIKGPVLYPYKNEEICMALFHIRIFKLGACWLQAGVRLVSYNCFCTDICICVCPPPRLLITSSMIWTPCDWLNKFYGCYMATVVVIIKGHGLGIGTRHRH